MAVDEPLESIDFDRTSRHRLLAEIVAELTPAPARVLDIGGSEGLTAQFLDGHHVLTIDVRTHDPVDILGSGAALPFTDGAFEAVFALDVLEHIPAELRPVMLKEAARVSKELVIFAGPYDEPGVADAERAAQEVFVALFERPNEWLTEHATFGLPDRSATEQELRSQGLTVSVFGSNHLALWRTLQHANFVAARVGSEPLHAAFNRRLYEGLPAEVDAQEPVYRRFVIGTRSGRRPSRSADRDPTDTRAGLAQWLDELEVHRGEIINETMQRLGAYTAEVEEGWRGAVEDAAAKAKGWRDAAAQVMALQGVEGRAAALEHALGEEQRQSAALHAGWREAARQFDVVQRTLYAYEQALFRQRGDWLESVRGPAVVATPTPRPNDASRYDQGREERVPSVIAEPGPKFSLLVPVFNPDSRFLEACIRSVRSQTYPNWQLVLVNVSTAPHVAPICRRFSLIDERITVVSAENHGIALNTSIGAQHAVGDWIVFLDHDDELAPHALAAVAAEILADPEVDFVYSDEDKIDGNRYVEPFYKPDWSPDLMRMVNYIGHLAVVRRSLYNDAGGMRSGFDGAQDFDFLLRATPRARRIAHIPDVLYHWRRHDLSTAADVLVKPDAHGAGRRSLQAFADEYAPGAWVDVGSGPTTHRMRYPLRSELVTIVVPFRDGSEITDICLRSISRYANDLSFEVLLVSNQSTDPKTFAMIEDWGSQYPWARAVEYDEPFNFQALNNWAARQAEGTLLLFLNNDTEALHDGWIDGLAEYAQRPEVGAVGARLLFPDGLVQHAGVAVGIGGFADHPWRGLHPDTWTSAGPSYWVRNFLSVTAACMMIERSKFEEIGGFDERFTVCGGDVDLGIRLHEAGFWNVMTPFVRLVHHESLTREAVPPDQDMVESQRAYAAYLRGRDPFYNPNLTLADTTCAIADPNEDHAREARTDALRSATPRR